MAKLCHFIKNDDIIYELNGDFVIIEQSREVKISILLQLYALSGLLFPLSAWQGGVETTLTTRYLWRGMIWSEGPALQTSLGLAQPYLSLSVWTNLPLLALPQSGWDETDLYLTFSRDLTPFLSMEGIVSHYRYPHSNDPYTWEGELAGLIAWRSYSLRVAIAKDIQAYPSSLFLTIATSQTFSLPKGFGEWGGEVGWGNRSFKKAYVNSSSPNLSAGLHHLSWKALVGRELSPPLALSLSAEWAILFLPERKSLSLLLKQSTIVLATTLTYQIEL